MKVLNVYSRNDLLVECMKILSKDGMGCFVSVNVKTHL